MTEEQRLAIDLLKDSVNVLLPLVTASVAAFAAGVGSMWSGEPKAQSFVKSNWMLSAAAFAAAIVSIFLSLGVMGQLSKIALGKPMAFYWLADVPTDQMILYVRQLVYGSEVGFAAFIAIVAVFYTRLMRSSA